MVIDYGDASQEEEEEEGTTTTKQTKTKGKSIKSNSPVCSRNLIKAALSDNHAFGDPPPL